MKSSSFQWLALLQQLGEATSSLPDIQSVSDAGGDPTGTPLGWFGHPPASENEILELEARLGVGLPPSYREFFKVTNGWGPVGNFIDRVYPVVEVTWCRDAGNGLVEDWMQGEAEYPSPPIRDEDYFTYGKDQDTVNLRVEYLPGCLQVSDIGDVAVLLLNPAVQTAEGEWEAWFFAGWLPGARRYRSFYELMEGELETTRRLRADLAEDDSLRSMPRPSGEPGSDEPSR